MVVRLPNCCTAASALHASSSVMWQRLRWFFIFRLAWREIPELAASLMIAINFVPSLKCCKRIKHEIDEDNLKKQQQQAAACLTKRLQLSTALYRRVGQVNFVQCNRQRAVKRCEGNEATKTVNKRDARVVVAAATDVTNTCQSTNVCSLYRVRFYTFVIYRCI